jgi:hypothetical protein
MIMSYINSKRAQNSANRNTVLVEICTVKKSIGGVVMGLQKFRVDHLLITSLVSPVIKSVLQSPQPSAVV